MNETERREWNDAVARGDAAEVDRLAELHLRRIHERQLDDWAPRRRCQ